MTRSPTSPTSSPTRPHEQYGICLRGKPGWGENMAFFDTLVNAYGGQWFDMKWKPQLTAARGRRRSNGTST